MKVTDDFIKANKKYYKATPDAGFSPARNKQIIEDSIKAYEANRAKRRKEYAGKLDERSDAVASYFQHVNQRGGSSLEKYFGRRELARLQGRKIYEKITNGKIRFEEVN
jgi:hypothetical protein